MTSKIRYNKAMQTNDVGTLPWAYTLKRANTRHQHSLDKKISSKHEPTALLSTIADETEALDITEGQRRPI